MRLPWRQRRNEGEGCTVSLFVSLLLFVAVALHGGVALSPSVLLFFQFFKSTKCIEYLRTPVLGGFQCCLSTHLFVMFGAFELAPNTQRQRLRSSKGEKGVDDPHI